MLSHFIMLRNISEYNRWSEWWHLDLHKASEEILSECLMEWLLSDLRPSCGKLPCSCYYWNKMSIWGYSPTRNKLKLWNQPLLPKPKKAQRAFLEWTTPENHPLEDLRYPPRLCADTEGNPPRYCLKICQNPPIGKGWPLAQSQSSKPPKETQSEAPKKWTVSSLSRMRRH